MKLMKVRTAIGIGAVALVAAGGGSALADANEIIPPVEFTCHGEPITMFLEPGATQGTDNKDVVWGTSGPAAFYGKGGDDVVCLVGGDDFAHGGEGADTI